MADIGEQDESIVSL